MYADDYEDYFPHAGEAYGNNITGNGCWKPMIAPYHGLDELLDSNLERGVFNCPSQQDGNCGVSTYGDGGFYGGYAWNWLYLGWRNTPENGLVTPHAAFVKRSQLKKPSRTIEIQGSTDMISTSTPYQNFYIYPNSSSRAAYRHNGGPNILWADSHASWHLQEEIDDNYDWYKRD
jgi:prepilin-type processing-associated H-X9-DG protein